MKSFTFLRVETKLKLTRFDGFNFLALFLMAQPHLIYMFTMLSIKTREKKISSKKYIFFNTPNTFF